MKPFNLESAKRGDPVVTREGRIVRIICFDRCHNTHPIVALVKEPDGCERLLVYSSSGRGVTQFGGGAFDLFMATKKEKWWIVWWVEHSATPYTVCYRNKEVAKDHMKMSTFNGHQNGIIEIEVEV